MKLIYRNKMLNSLKLMLSFILVIFSFYSVSVNGEENDENSKADSKSAPVTQRKLLTKTIPTDEQFRKNPGGMCGRACQNLSSCQKDEDLNNACWKHCPKSGCVRRGKKPESTPAESK